MSTTAQPGDLVFAHSTGVIGRAIRLAERLRWKRASEWNHVAIVDRIENEKVYIIQAEARGVTDTATLDTVAPGGHYEIVPPPAEVDRDRLLAFARGEVGTKYGYVTILAIAVSIIAPWVFTVHVPGTWVCSAVAAEALRAGGWVHRWPDVYSVTPAQLRLALA